MLLIGPFQVFQFVLRYLSTYKNTFKAVLQKYFVQVSQVLFLHQINILCQGCFQLYTLLLQLAGSNKIYLKYLSELFTFPTRTSMTKLRTGFGLVSANSCSRDLFLTESPTSTYRKCYQNQLNKVKTLQKYLRSLL